MSELPDNPKKTAYAQQVLEGALYEGAFAALTADANALTRMLKTTDMTFEDTQEQLDDLNARASKYIGSRAVLHGRARFAEISRQDDTDGDEDGSSDTMYAAKGDPSKVSMQIGSKRYFEDLTVTFDGFRVIEEPIEIDGEVIAMDRKAAILITRPATAYETKLRPDVEAFTGLAEVREAHLEFASMSAERAGMWLEYFAPDVKEEIDDVILNAVSPRDAFLSLKKLAFTPPSEGLAHEFELALDVYLDSIMEIDHEVPYVVSLNDGQVIVEKSAILENSDKSYTEGTITGATYLVKLKKVLTWKAVVDESEKMALIPHVRMSVLKSDPNNPPVELIVPSPRIDDIRSVRDEFYGKD